jgi:hypothetical protein
MKLFRRASYPVRYGNRNWKAIVRGEGAYGHHGTLEDIRHFVIGSFSEMIPSDIKE